MTRDVADIHPAELEDDGAAAVPATRPAGTGGWRAIFFDPDPAINARYAQIDAELAMVEPRLSRRARTWSVLAGIVLSWLLVALLAWLVWGSDAPPHDRSDPAAHAAARLHLQG